MKGMNGLCPEEGDLHQWDKGGEQYWWDRGGKERMNLKNWGLFNNSNQSTKNCVCLCYTHVTTYCFFGNNDNFYPQCPVSPLMKVANIVFQVQTWYYHGS